MTGGWAATNALRELVGRDRDEIVNLTRAMPGERKRFYLERVENAEAALALMEAALDAFEEWGYQRRRFIDGETDIVTLRDAEANALAALRAVREPA